MNESKHPDGGLYDRHKIIVDLKAKRTELGWAVVMDQFFLKFVPWLFSVTGWIVFIGALRFLGEKTNGFWFTAIAMFLNVLIYPYFVALFWRIKIKGFPYLKSQKAYEILSAIFSVLLAWGVYLLTSHLSSLAALAEKIR